MTIIISSCFIISGTAITFPIDELVGVVAVGNAHDDEVPFEFAPIYGIRRIIMNEVIVETI